MKYRFYALHAGEDIPSCDEIYDSKNDVRQRLASFHEIDWPEEMGPIENASLDTLLDHGEWGLIEIAFMCPLCHEGEVIYRHWMSTPVYSCEACPFLAIEYLTDKDTDALSDYLKHN